MYTVSDIVAFNRERASRHIRQSGVQWWIAGVLLGVALIGGAFYASARSVVPPVAASSSANR